MRAVAVLLPFLFVVPPVAAQGDVERQGLWGSFTIGAGSAGVSCGFCTDERQWAPSGSMAFGGTLSRQILIGGGASAYGRLTETSDTYLGWAYGLVRAYPMTDLGAFLSGGVGIAYGRGVTDIDDYHALGAGFVAGAGWDIGLGPSFAITAQANAHFSAGGYLEQNGAQAATGGFNPSLFTFSLGMTLF